MTPEQKVAYLVGVLKAVHKLLLDNQLNLAASAVANALGRVGEST